MRIFALPRQFLPDKPGRDCPYISRKSKTIHNLTCAPLADNVALRLRSQEGLAAFGLGEMCHWRKRETKSFLVLVTDILCQCVAAGRARSRGSIHWSVGSCGRRCSRRRRSRGAQSSGCAADFFLCYYRQSMRRASCRRIREKSGRVHSRLRKKRRQVFASQWRQEIRTGWKC
jgi:hypothetical protein